MGDLQPYADARCSQKPIARKIHVQVACDQIRMFSGTKFVWHPSKYMQKDVTKRDWYRTKAFHLYEPFLSLLGCSACTMDGPYAQQNLRGCSLPSRVHETANAFFDFFLSACNARRVISFFPRAMHGVYFLSACNARRDLSFTRTMCGV